VSRVRAIVALRFKLAVRRARGPGGTARLVGAVLTGVFSVLFALALAVGLGIMLHLFGTGGDPVKIRLGFLIVFWVSFFFGIVLPLLRGALQQGLDASPFVVFPVSRPRLYGITLAACLGASDHALYYPTLVAVAVTGVIVPGVNAVAGLTLIALALLSLVIWGNALALFLVSVMRARRVREITGILVFLTLIAASFAPALLDDPDGGLRQVPSEVRIVLHTALRVGQLLPPTIAAEGLTALHSADGSQRVATSTLLLLLWDVAGILIGYFIFHRFHLGERSSRPAGRARRLRPAAGTPTKPTPFDRRPLSALPPQVRAVAAKDLHYLFRSVIGKFNLFLMPVFVLVVVFLVGRSIDHPVLGLDPQRLLLFGLLLYAVLFSNNFVNNAFAWEGDGVRSYFLCPASPRQVLVGKNLAVWLFNAILFIMVILIFSALTGFPGIAILASATFMYASALLIFTACGNIISVLLPVPRDMSAINNQPAQTAILLSLLVLVSTALLIGPLLSLPMLLGWPLVQPVLLAAFLAVSIGAYAWSLRPAARLLESRREQIMEALKSVR
jgi:hypothetical protein